MPVRDILNAASSQGAGPSDPYFYDVSLLLNGDGTNGAQNNTFLDSSSNAFTITRNGNTTQGSFSPYGNLWSNYFNGSSWLLSTSSQIIPSGSFTVEGWVYPTSNVQQYAINQGTSGGTGRFALGMLSGSWYVQLNSVNVNAGTIALNQWTYLAATFNGSTVTLYVNGTSVGSVSNTTNAQNTTLRIGGLGSDWGTGTEWNGYVSNVRISNTVRTISTPSTSPLSVDGNTVFLGCQANRFIDASSNNYALTVGSGSPSVQRFSPFNPTAPYSTATIGGSGYFDYSGSYLSVADNTAMTLTGDNTIEAFVYLNSYNGSYSTVVARWQASGTEEEFLFWIDNSGTPQFYFKPFSTGTPLLSGGTAPLNSWVHLAVVRSSNSWALFVNGTRTATATNSGVYSDTTATTTIGSIRPTYTSYDLKGYVTNVRLVKGTAIYSPSSTTITVPTAPLTNVSGTSLLCNMTNAGIPDLAMQNDLETVGNAQVSTSVVKYGTGSIAFDGTGDYLTLPSSPTLGFGTGDFTIECWVYLTSAAGIETPIGSSWNYYTSGYNGNFVFRVGTTNLWRSFDGQSSQATIDGSFSWSTGVWYHMAWVRSGTTVTVYRNGTSIGSVTDSKALSNGINGFVIGGQRVNGSLSTDFAGYIDDFRITDGYARYTTTFTPPTAALPTY